MLFENKNLIAIDVGASCVKMLELTGGSSKNLKALGLKMLPEGLIRAGNIENPEELGKIIAGLAKELGIRLKGRRASVGLGGTSVLVRRILLDNAGDVFTVDEQIKQDFEQQFQLGIDELLTNYYLDTGNELPDGRIPVITAAAKQEVAHQYVTAVKSAGLKIGVIECGALALVNLLEFNYGQVPGLAAIVSVGAQSTQVVFTLFGQYYYHRDFPFGGSYYTEEIAKRLQIDKLKAENLKVTANSSQGETPIELIKIFGDLNAQVVNEISGTIEFFFSSNEIPSDISAVQSFFMTGGGSRVLGLDAAIAARFKAPVSLLTPFHKIGVKSKRFEMDYVLSQGHLYGNAVGLALRKFEDDLG
jgi:type IV pilus assembly protein PilM